MKFFLIFFLFAACSSIDVPARLNDSADLVFQLKNNNQESIKNYNNLVAILKKDPWKKQQVLDILPSIQSESEEIIRIAATLEQNLDKLATQEDLDDDQRKRFEEQKSQLAQILKSAAVRVEYIKILMKRLSTAK